MRAVTLAVLLAVFAGGAYAQSDGQTNSNANTAASPTPERTPIPTAAIVTEAENAAERVAAIRAETERRSAKLIEIEERLPSAAADIQSRRTESQEALAAGPTLDELRAIERRWQSDSEQLSEWKKAIETRLAGLTTYRTELAGMKEAWVKSRDAALGADPIAPPEVLQRINEVIAAIDQTATSIDQRQSAIISVQSQVSDLETQVKNILAEVRLVRERALSNLFTRESQPIWAAGQAFGSFGQIATSAAASISAQFATLRDYLSGHGDRLVLHILLFVLMTAGLFWARSRVRPYVEKEPELETAAQIFEVPFATALVIAVMVSSWFYPQAPRALSVLLGAIVIIPVVILLRRLVDRPLFIVLNALVALYFVDRFRELLVDQAFAERIVFLIEKAAAIVFLAWFWTTKRLERKVEARHYRLFAAVRRMIPFALAIFAAGFISNALGYVALSYVIGNGVLSSAYLALIIYTAVRIVESLVIFALRVRPFSGLQAVAEHRVLVRTKIVRFVYWIGAFIWLIATLRIFSVADAVFGFVRWLLSYSVSYGSIEISLGDVLLFVVTVWAAILVSRFLRFILAEDVYPRIGLGGGVSYAVSTVLHYALLVAGFMFAVAALGVDFTKFAIIAGAVGIGIGFGLQNIINNFVSGLILLFEQPVKVEDTIQIGEHTGSLKKIGLRASVLRKFDGSDVIVPNSQLISDEVINWTMADQRRRIDIPVGVAYGTSPLKVVDLLSGISTKYPEILNEPAPAILFTGLGESSLDFEYRAWTADSDGWVGLRSKLLTDIYTVLDEAGIEIPFPQRDLNIRSGGETIGNPTQKPARDATEN